MPNAHASSTPRRLIILGSTGSIGVNTLKVARHLTDSGALRVEVVGLAAGGNVDLLIEQARQFHVEAIALASDGSDKVEQVRRALPNVKVYAGADAARQLVENTPATDLTAAIVGSAGLPATLAGVRKGLRIGLANKETLVAAGALVAPLVRKHGALLIPVDSEHSAIFQCLQGTGSGPRGSGVDEPQAGLGYRVSGVAEKNAVHADDPSDTRNPTPETRNPSQSHAYIKRIVLTASGGPFRTADLATMRNATVEQALNHPTWKMGPKITIDSATMMNKALEIIEAHWLFDLPPEKISVIIHPQSVAHSFVEFADHSVLAQLGPPDMCTPIQYALTYPDRPQGCSRAMDWTTLNKLEFEQPDHERFPSLKLAYDVIEAGGTAGAVFNAANEAAVAAFLERKIRFGRIVELVAETLAAIEPRPVEDLDTIMAADAMARAFVNQRVTRNPNTGI